MQGDTITVKRHAPAQSAETWFFNFLKASVVTPRQGMVTQGLVNMRCCLCHVWLSSISNKTHAALLYALAAEQGDVHSMVHLAWLLHEGGDGLVKNNSAARALFLTAADSEFRDESAGGPLNTNGVASQIGLLVLAWDDTVMWVRSMDPILLENAAIFFLLCLLSILYWSRRILAAARAGGERRPRPRPFLLHPEPR